VVSDDEGVVDLVCVFHRRVKLDTGSDGFQVHILWRRLWVSPFQYHRIGLFFLFYFFNDFVKLMLAC
jgi:hypothetical protein